MTWVDSSRAWIKLVHAPWSMAKPRPHQPGLAENASIRSRHVHARGRQLHQARARLHVPAHEAPVDHWPQRLVGQFTGAMPITNQLSLRDSLDIFLLSTAFLSILLSEARLQSAARC